MDFTKKIEKLQLLVVFIYLSLFPLGQLLRGNISLFGNSVPVSPIDVFVLFGFILLFVKRKKELVIVDIFKDYFLVIVFSMLLSLFLFTPGQVFIGALYFGRLIVYLGFGDLIFNLTGNDNNLKKLFYGSLIMVSLAVSILGWVQYLLVPDARPLQFLGWDDHLYRMVGTFLDPTFTGIIIVFGALLALSRYFDKPSKVNLFLFFFLSISSAFTYSRAVLVGLFAGLIFLCLVKRRLRFLILSGLILVAVLFNLPRPSSQGVRLERLHSVFNRFQNYEETSMIIEKSPVFGIGYNNLCWARNLVIGQENPLSHSCSGTDSSLLLILSTTGVVGLMIFITKILQLLKRVSRNFYGLGFISCAVAIVFHSQFANSLFYPWVLGYMVILLGISLTARS